MADKALFEPSRRHGYFVRMLRERLKSPNMEIDDSLATSALLQMIMRRIFPNGAIRDTPEANAGIDVAFECLNSYWKKDVDEYEKLSIADSHGFMQDFVRMMTIGQTNLFFDRTLATHFNWGDFTFKANISPIPGTHQTRFRIYLSSGLMMALDDLAFRAFCNQALFSWEIGNGQLWHGCQCYFAHLHKNYARPTLRYWDYSFDANQMMMAAAREEPIFVNLVPLFYSGIPIGDDQRVPAAGFASTVAYAWVIAHEVGHYRHGHFGYSKDNPTAFGRNLKLAIASDQIMMAEGTSQDQVPMDSFLKRFFEWDADRAATESIVDIFYHPDQVKNLPSYCKQKAWWLFRLVLLGMVMAAMIFDRAAQAAGDALSHPSGLARFIGIVIAVSRRLHELTFPSHNYDEELAEFTSAPTIEKHFLF